MATWEDGPEYAPAQRPTGFAMPDVAPLEQAPPPQQPSAGAPAAQPQFREADRPGPALVTIAPEKEDGRDPRQPFSVSQATMTSQTSAWAGAHWSQHGPATEPAPSPQGAAPAGVDPTWGPPDAPSPVAGAPGTGYPAPHLARDAATPFHLTNDQPGYPAPTGALPGQPPAPDAYPPPTGSPVQPGTYPTPGTVDWFAPPPQHAAVQHNDRQLSLVEGLTVGYVVALGACIVYPLAPICLVIGLLLSRRVQICRQFVPKMALGAGILWGLIALITLVGGPLSFGDWWWTISLWALLIGLALLISSLVVAKVVRDKERPDPYRSGWG